MPSGQNTEIQVLSEIGGLSVHVQLSPCFPATDPSDARICSTYRGFFSLFYLSWCMQIGLPVHLSVFLSTSIKVN